MPLLPVDEKVVAVWIKLFRLERSLLNTVNQNLRKAGFPPLGWYDILWELKKTPTHRLRPLEIEQRVLLTQYNLSRLIDRMVKKSYVSRESCGNDKRGQWIVLTEQGKVLREQMWPIYAASIQQYLGLRLQVEEVKFLNDILTKLLVQEKAANGAS
ncbi:MAG: winged helix-turn-helix transcriptional regulator [Rhodospirillaceae bacterium]|nr:winged helix-turn-helix transcriptional regulator [Rhodospirillaceae bacterium]